MEISQCVICWKDYYKKTHNQKICSKECRRILSNKSAVERNYSEEWKNKRSVYAKRYYEKYKEKIILKVKNFKPYKHICNNCLIEFNSWHKNTRYCSSKCNYIKSKELRIWELNPSYRNWMYSKLSNINKMRVWQEIFKKVCKILDDDILNKFWYLYCQNCWTSNSLRFEHHHIIYRSEKPKHEELHNIKNIILVCIKCHNYFHKSKWNRNDIVKERNLNELFWDDILDK